MANATRRICSIDYCDRSVTKKKLCNAHYLQWYRGQPFRPPLPRVFVPESVPCKFVGCSKGGRRTKGYCAGHYNQVRLGKALAPLKYQGDPAHPRGSQCPGPSCDRLVASNGLCYAHDDQRRRGSELSPIRKLAPHGSGSIDSHGYRKIRVAGHPNATLNGVIAEHRFVMAEHLGRPLELGENVHHINGDRQDNRLENLELWSTTQPQGQRVVDKVAWAREILSLYGDDF